MKREFAERLRCIDCGGGAWTVRVDAEDAREIREGELLCHCGIARPIRKGIVDFVDSGDPLLQAEVKGWIELAGPLGEDLFGTMCALPYYPHPPWPPIGQDFFQLFEHFDFTGKRVIDIGSGRAWSSRHLAAMGNAREVVAVDVLATKFLGLETADIYFDQDQQFFERVRSDLHRLPFADGAADVVFSCASLHHSSDLRKLFHEIRRVLKPGGHLIFIGEPSKRASIEATRPDNEETAHGINEHIYSLAEYTRALEDAGFAYRRLVPRSIRYRMLYGDGPIAAEIPRVLSRLPRSDRGRDWIHALLANRWTGSWLYRVWSLPLTVIATRR